MLELKELYKTFNPGTINAKTALNGLSLTLNDGDFVTVIGGNGAGKSTMLNAPPARSLSTPARSSSTALTSRTCPSTSARHSSAASFRIP